MCAACEVVSVCFIVCLLVWLVYSGIWINGIAIAVSEPTSMLSACNASCHVTVLDCSNRIAFPNAAAANATAATDLMMVFLPIPVIRYGFALRLAKSAKKFSPHSPLAIHGHSA